jgi:hypothetical protein
LFLPGEEDLNYEAGREKYEEYTEAKGEQARPCSPKVAYGHLSG